MKDKKTFTFKFEIPSIVFLIISALMIIGIILFFSSCTTENDKSIDSKQKEQQNIAQKDMQNKIGNPNITKWAEKKQLKKIYELRDDAKLICYLYTRNEMTGKYIYEGRCQGFGIPYSTQYSNPERAINYEDELGENIMDGEPVGNLPYPEPNGLWMPDSSSATWVSFIDEKTGKAEVQYFEPLIVVTQTKKPARLCEKWSLPEDY